MTVIISFSELVKWQTCQRQYYYRYILNRKPIDVNGPIDTGTKGHKLLQNFYELLRNGKTKEEAHALTEISATKMMKEEGPADFPLLKAWILVDNYIRATEFFYEAVEVEKRFLFPAAMITSDSFFSNVEIGFTPDVVFRRKGNFLDVEDYKFVGRAWSEKKLNRFSQLKLYQAFLDIMGYNTSRTVIRFFNTTTAKITEKPYTQTAMQKEILLRDFLTSAKDMVEFKQKNIVEQQLAPRTMNNMACGFCSYEFVCTLEAEGKDASKSLKNLFREGDYDYSK